MPNRAETNETESGRELWRQQTKARQEQQKLENITLRQRGQMADYERGQQEAMQGGTGEGVSRSPRAIMQRLNAERQKSRTVKEALASQLPGAEALAKIEEIKKAVERLKWIYRVVNGTSGVTVVGLILTFLVMNAQLIFGNLFKAKFVPPLNFVEGIIIGFVDFAVFINLLIIAFYVVLLAGMYYEITQGNIWEKVKLIWGVGLKSIWDALGGH